MRNSETALTNDLSTSTENVYRFEEFVLNPRRRMLFRNDSPVSLTPKAFDLLTFLVQNPNRLVTKDEFLHAVWGEAFVEEGNLTRYISYLRKAIGDDAEDTRLIVTIARKGYQFTAQVTASDASNIAEQTQPEPIGKTSSETDPRPAEISSGVKVPKSPSSRLILRKWIPMSALLAVIASVLCLYWNCRQRVTLSVSDTIVLADVTNQTSDPAFEDALNTVLRYAVGQTPYLNTLSIDKVYGTMAELNLAPTTKMNPEVGRQICLRTNSKLLIATSIADAGNGFRIDLDAADCQSGRNVASIHEFVADRNQVVHVFGAAFVRLRQKLGEPTASLARFNKPLDEALSPSIDALRAGTMGYKRHLAGDFQGAISYYDRALELDPNLAPTYEGLGAAYHELGDESLTVSAITKAYQLRNRMTEASRLETEYLYYAWVTRDLNKALSVLRQSVQTFPRNVTAHVNLAGCLVLLGQPDKAIDEAREAARLQPTAYTYAKWAITSIRAERLNEAQAALDEAVTRKLHSSELRDYRIRLAFLQHDQRTMQEQWNQAKDKAEDYELLLSKSEIEEYQGHFRNARELIQQALEVAPGAPAERRHQISLWQSWPRYALWEAECGNSARAKQIASIALETVGDRDQEQYLALAFARVGDIENARKLVDALDKNSPLDTLVQNYSLPTIRAAMKLNGKDPAGAIAALQPAQQYELTVNPSFNGPYPAYLRGLAYLQLGKGRLAAAEFQKLLDHRGVVGIDVIGALVYVQMARAQKMVGDDASARMWYEQFLELWKDADPDIPIFRQAEAEYARLGK
jgi:eukaryotic-like serine/threonine-protein kinase